MLNNNIKEPIKNLITQEPNSSFYFFKTNGHFLFKIVNHEILV